MQPHEISVGHTIITGIGKRGVSYSGQVLSKGPKYCTVLDKGSRQNMRIPYSFIIATDNKIAALDIPRAKVRDIVVGPKGEKFRIEKVNSANYVATSLTNGVSYRLPIGSVVEVCDSRSIQKEFLAAKGLSESDIAEFFSLAA